MPGYIRTMVWCLGAHGLLGAAWLSTNRGFGGFEGIFTQIPKAAVAKDNNYTFAGQDK